MSTRRLQTTSCGESRDSLSERLYSEGCLVWSEEKEEQQRGQIALLYQPTRAQGDYGCPYFARNTVVGICSKGSEMLPKNRGQLPGKENGNFTRRLWKKPDRPIGQSCTPDSSPVTQCMEANPQKQTLRRFRNTCRLPPLVGRVS